jgi:outer membrane protein OmpA-like peptidoglycan-associated protein
VKELQRSRRVRWVGLALSLCLVLAGCTKTVTLARSVDNVSRDLSRQVQRGARGKRLLVIDPVIDSRTGQQTRGSMLLQQTLAEQLRTRLKDVEIVPFDKDTVSKADLLLTGSLTGLPQRGTFRMSVALTDIKSGIVVAQSAGQFREASLDSAPTEFYRDSPSLVRDRSIDGLLKTAQTDRGEAADALYIEQVPTSALLANALEAYNAGRVQEALDFYAKAAERKDGQQLRTFNGLYLCNVRLGRMDAAGKAFDKIVALGLSTGNLSVKLLFRPGGTEFWPDPKVSGVYPMWLSRIANAARSTAICLNIVGHTSRSGTIDRNDELSLERATVIRDRLAREAPGLGQKLRVAGKGFHENIVGSGADDASDAVDRRVEFRVESCTAQ